MGFSKFSSGLPSRQTCSKYYFSGSGPTNIQKHPRFINVGVLDMAQCRHNNALWDSNSGLKMLELAMILLHHHSYLLKYGEYCILARIRILVVRYFELKIPITIIQILHFHGKPDTDNNKVTTRVHCSRRAQAGPPPRPPKSGMKWCWQPHCPATASTLPCSTEGSRCVTPHAHRQLFCTP